MNITTVEFKTSAVRVDQYPHLQLPEYAFFGRSNTGKSSLINMILNRKKLVKTGARPGTTQAINFFAVNNLSEKNKNTAFCLVDLPGYGYARTNQLTKKKFDVILYDYCLYRKELRMIFLLSDIRRPPAKVEKDILIFFQMQQIPFTLIATKADKVSKNEQNNIIHTWADFFNCQTQDIIITSCLKKIGRNKILSVISNDIHKK